MIHLILLTDFTETYATELLRGILDYSQGHEPHAYFLPRGARCRRCSGMG